MPRQTLFGILTAAMIVSAPFDSGAAWASEFNAPDWVSQDLTRWQHLPIANLPPLRFEGVVIDGRDTRGSGSPNIPRKLDLSVIARNGGFSLAHYFLSSQSHKPERVFTGIIGGYYLSTDASGGSEDWTRKILDLVFLGRVPGDPRTVEEAPSIHGVRATDLSYKLEERVRIDGGAKRTFILTNKVVGVDFIGVKINGRRYEFDCYIIETITKNKYRAWRITRKSWYIPAIGYYGKQTAIIKSGSTISGKFIWDDYKYEMTEDQLREIMNFRRNSSPSTAVPAPGITTASPSQPGDIKERLQKLKDWFGRGLITKEEYRQKRREILEDL